MLSLGCDTSASGGSTATSDAATQMEAGPAQQGDAALDSGASPDSRCAQAGLLWRSARKTNYESYPAPGSEECVKYHGCDYLGQFQACANAMPESWVAGHDIASVFPLEGLELHSLCLRAGSRTMIVTVIDTCADSDCGGCCTENRGDADRLIDLEKYTNERFGVDDGDIEWADLGPVDTSFDGCN
jgi:hypothetical protein